MTYYEERKAKERELKIAEEIVNLKKDIEGKKIVSVEAKASWDKTEISHVVLHFDDGSELRLSASTQSGCEECNYDGSNVNYLNLDFSEKRE